MSWHQGPSVRKKYVFPLSKGKKHIFWEKTCFSFITEEKPGFWKKTYIIYIYIYPAICSLDVQGWIYLEPILFQWRSWKTCSSWLARRRWRCHGRLTRTNASKHKWIRKYTELGELFFKLKFSRFMTFHELCTRTRINKYIYIYRIDYGWIIIICIYKCNYLINLDIYLLIYLSSLVFSCLFFSSLIPSHPILSYPILSYPIYLLLSIYYILLLSIYLSICLSI